MSDSEYALQVRLEAKPEKADEVEASLESALPMAEAEEQTTTWFALRFDDTTFGIFDTFADELLAEEPQIQEVDVLAAKHSG